MQVRIASLEDLAEVQIVMKRLDNEKINASDTKELKDFIAKRNCYIAVEKEQIKGVVNIEISESNCEIESIASLEKGAGRKLVEYLIEKCKKERISKLWCWSLARYNVKGFYEKMGFEEQILLKKHWFGEDCYLFGRVI